MRVECAIKSFDKKTGRHSYNYNYKILGSKKSNTGICYFDKNRNFAFSSNQFDENDFFERQESIFLEHYIFSNSGK